MRLAFFVLSVVSCHGLLGAERETHTRSQRTQDLASNYLPEIRGNLHGIESDFNSENFDVILINNLQNFLNEMENPSTASNLPEQAQNLIRRLDSVATPGTPAASIQNALIHMHDLLQNGVQNLVSESLRERREAASHGAGSSRINAEESSSLLSQISQQVPQLIQRWLDQRNRTNRQHLSRDTSRAASPQNNAASHNPGKHSGISDPRIERVQTPNVPNPSTSPNPLPSSSPVRTRWRGPDGRLWDTATPQEIADFKAFRIPTSTWAYGANGWGLVPDGLGNRPGTSSWGYINNRWILFPQESGYHNLPYTGPNLSNASLSGTIALRQGSGGGWSQVFPGTPGAVRFRFSPGAGFIRMP